MMNKTFCIVFITFITFTIQAWQVEARHKRHSNEKMSMLQKWQFLRFLQLFSMKTMTPRKHWDAGDKFLKNNNNFENDSNQMFQVHRFNIGAKMARLNGDIPPLSSYYINFDQDSSSVHRTTNLLG